MNNLVAHMRTSAEAGNADAQFNLAVMLGNGFGLSVRRRFFGSIRLPRRAYAAPSASLPRCAPRVIRPTGKKKRALGF